MVLLCFGTRPEWLKIKPLIKVLDDYQLLFTGQHPDLLKDLKVDYKITIKDNPNRLDQLISDCLLQFPEGKFDSVLVQGDTASAFACAVAAFNRKKKIYYLEAGLRSYNLDHPYPEEGYRQMISRISDVNFCPTQLSSDKNLIETWLDDQQNPKETFRPLPFDTLKGALQEWLSPEEDEEGEISSEPPVGFDDEKPESNYSLSTKKKETKVDKFDEMFDKEDDLPF